MILALFSGAGGRMILYRPGMAPIEAPQVPIVYQLMKSVGHSTMALAEVAGPYSTSGRQILARRDARLRGRSVGPTVRLTPMIPGWCDNNRTILQTTSPSWTIAGQGHDPLRDP